MPLEPPRCRGCGAALVDAAQTGLQRRQVIDIPEPAPLQVTEYQRISKACPGCGAVTAAGWDEPAVPKRTRRDRRRAWLASAYRPQTLAQAALLTCAHYLPVGMMDLEQSHHPLQDRHFR
ncbi:MAG: IS66 family transposase zinc-finger binding domain-containing protein [Mycobacterium sp.]|uniref:IS66 family transposase zinc-finger binding domain-containing protein n=1 Tax=Mycobacterium sp. TaxID=1785 RepID=UPI003F9976F3